MWRWRSVCPRGRSRAGPTTPSARCGRWPQRRSRSRGLRLSPVGRQALAASDGEEAVVVRAGQLVDGGAGRAVVGADDDLVETAAEVEVALGPAALGLEPDDAAALEHDVHPTGHTGDVLPVPLVRHL